MASQKLTEEGARRAEALVTRIQGVSSCRISIDDEGTITEVHVVAANRKAPKLVARDVESCLKAEMGVDVDYKKIGVVVVDADAPEALSGEEIAEFPIEEHPPRFVFGSVNVTSSRDGVRAEVELSRDGADAYGAGASDNTSVPAYKVVAEATLRAVSEYLDAPTRLCLVDVLKVDLGGEPAFVTRVDLSAGQVEKALAGCSIDRGDEFQAVVFATLDAVNRVVGVLDFKSSIEFKIR